MDLSRRLDTTPVLAVTLKSAVASLESGATPHGHLLCEDDMPGFGPFDVMLDEQKRGVLLDEMIDEFVPTLRQEAFLEHARECMDNGLLTRRAWLKAQDNHPVFAEVAIHHSAEMAKWWEDEVFKGWLFRKLLAFEISEWERTLMDAVFWEKLANLMATGNLDALKLYSKIRIEKQDGNGDMDSLRNEVKGFLGDADTDGFGTTIPEA